MTPRRLTATAFAVVALAGCGGIQKPSPGVSVYSGSDTIRLDAAVFCHEGAEKCAEDPVKVARLKVTPGDTIGISVDSAIAKRGWYLATATETESPKLTEHYYKFSVGREQFRESNAVNLQVVTLASEQTGQATGVWAFTLEQAEQ